MSAEFRIYQNVPHAGFINYHFKLIDGNEKTIITSEFYETFKACEKGVVSVRCNADRKDAVEIHQDGNGSEYFTLKAGNYEEIGRSSYFNNRITLMSVQSTLKKVARDAKVKRMF